MVLSLFKWADFRTRRSSGFSGTLAARPGILGKQLSLADDGDCGVIVCGHDEKRVQSLLGESLLVIAKIACPQIEATVKGLLDQIRDWQTCPKGFPRISRDERPRDK